MPVDLNVRQVRDEILRASGGPVHGLPDASTRLAGAWFHEIFAELLGSDPKLHARAALVESSGDAAAWSARLRDHVYRLLLGPRVQANQATFQTRTQEVLSLWQSLEELARWLGPILHNAWQQGAFSIAGSGAGGDGLFLLAEQPLS